MVKYIYGMLLAAAYISFMLLLAAFPFFALMIACGGGNCPTP